MSIENLIKELISATPAVRRRVEEVLVGGEGEGRKPEQDCRLVNISTAARLLGLSRGTTYSLLRSGRLPSVAVGGRVMVSRSAVAAFALGGREVA